MMMQRLAESNQGSARRRHLFLMGLLAFAILAAGCGERGERPDSEAAQQVAAWHAERLERLQAEDGWLTLIGLFPLTEGEHTLGAAEGVDLLLAADAPPVIGTLTVQPQGVSFAPAAGVSVTSAGEPLQPLPHDLSSDRDGAPTVLEVGTVRFHVIERGDRLFLRVKDSQSAVRRGFTGIERFAHDPSWRVVARLETGDWPRTVPIPDVLGRLEEQPCPGLLVFERDGFVHRLIPIGEAGQPLFIIFSDWTTGESTYGGGRYLYADPPGPDGTVVLDFNRAFNPPCVFTPYATCPLPPAENLVQAAVTAGEKAWRLEP
jgi:uncharacterized protein